MQAGFRASFGTELVMLPLIRPGLCPKSHTSVLVVLTIRQYSVTYYLYTYIKCPKSPEL